MRYVLQLRLGHASSVPEGTDWLTDDERRCIAQGARPKRIREFRLGRWTAKRLLAQTHGLAAAEVRRAPDGAPVAYHRDRPVPVGLSISHSGEFGLAAAGPATLSVGCDIERVEPRRPVFVADYFTPAEQRTVAQGATSVRDRWITAIWSAKESALKSLRTGLGRDPRSVEVDLGDGHPANGWDPLTVRDTQDDTVLLGFWRAVRGGDYVITVVADAPIAPQLSGDLSGDPGRPT